jgi:hypothetical protein
VGPSNDHELEIARVVDRVSLDEPLTPDIVPEVLAMLDFRISGSDKDFFDHYFQWRMDNPIAK